MSFEKLDNVTWLPTAQNERLREDPNADSTQRFDRSLVDGADNADLDNAARFTVNGGTDSDGEFTNVQQRIETLLADASVLTDVTPAIREQFAVMEQQFAAALPGGAEGLPRAGADTNNESSGPVSSEVYPGLRLNMQSGELEFPASSDPQLNDRWSGLGDLSREQVLMNAETMVEALRAQPLQADAVIVQGFVPDVVLAQRFSTDDAIVVTQAREYQLMRLDNDGSVTDVRVVEADGSLISASNFDSQGNHHYREYHEDGSAGLEISYDAEQVVRQVEYFDDEQNVVTREYYDDQGVLTGVEQFE